VEYHNLVRDFAARTRVNLDAMRNLRDSQEDIVVYEVTQLINSMLGLLIFPEQRYFHNIPETPLSELADQGWPIPKIVGDYPQVEDLRKLVRYLRNAISHCNVKFVSDEAGQIIGLQIWNVPTNRKEPNWKAELSLTDIEKITNKFIQLLLAENTQVG
jgi:hypothetical protein